MRLGYFGGSFDPPHRAHLLAARLARRQFQLDRVLLAPTGRQPLKKEGAVASFADRLRMVEMLCQGEPGLEASAIDGPRPAGEPNYTVDTLRRLRSRLAGLPSCAEQTAQGGALHANDFEESATLSSNSSEPPNAEVFAIIGADAFLGMRQWREPDELLRLAQWIVVSRPGFALETDRLQLSPAQRAAVHLLAGLEEPISATALRQRLRNDRHDPQLSALIPNAVLVYIEAHRLYRR